MAEIGVFRSGVHFLGIVLIGEEIGSVLLFGYLGSWVWVEGLIYMVVNYGRTGSGLCRVCW